MSLLSSSIGRLRLVSFLEGCSFVVLLTIAMPLKYLADRPEAVRVVGSLHGGLFMLFMLALLLVGLERRWSIARMVWATILASIPLGAFYFERQLRSEEPEPTQG